jgi:hypothetical protein
MKEKNKLIGCSFNKAFVGLWVVDLKDVSDAGQMDPLQVEHGHMQCVMAVCSLSQAAADVSVYQILHDEQASEQWHDAAVHRYFHQGMASPSHKKLLLVAMLT